ncbi:RND family transporter [Mycolicibacterium sp. J2]|uniref:MMPL/RND family transporter n=1 Tax=Mycolicibacterium sp. J2 TaxID=2993511 RepID=UPI00224A74AE|nr:RND family transporter [Mycolicibacterium sp. J2]MCX2713510.1 RND family transporter [Mycolicibacterium sp. J2]
MFKRPKVSAHAFLTGSGRLIVRHPVLMIATWVVIAGALFAALPPLATVAARNPPDFWPKDAPVLAAGNQMKTAFNEAGAGNMVAVVLVDENGLSTEDEATYRTLVDKLRARSDIVIGTQDFVHIPELKPAMTSKDGKAFNLPVSLYGTMGTGQGQQAYREAIKIIDEVTANTTLKASVVGAAATMEDVTGIALRDQHIIELSTVITVLVILIIVYRNIVAMIIPLLTIGISLGTAQQVIAGLGLIGLGLGPQTLMLITGMMIGAGIDYAVFLFSRYQEYLRGGMASDQAVVAALVSIGEVIAGSAGTVAITFMSLMFTQLAVFSTIGPALAVTIFVGFLSSVTLLPAFIVLAGRRGWVNPRKDITGRFWRLSGVNIVRRPWLNLVCSLIVLISLASCTLLVDFNYDDRKNLPVKSASNDSYETMNAHFPVSNSMQQFIVIHSDTQDLRSPRALADMEQMAARVAQLPDIAAVRGITRPNGEMLTEARATHQAGEVGEKMEEATNLISQNDGNLTALTDGSRQLADALNKLREQVLQSAGPLNTMLNALVEIDKEYGGTGTIKRASASAQLVDGLRNLGKQVGVGMDAVVTNAVWLQPALQVLNAVPWCSIDPACRAVRIDMTNLLNAYQDGTMMQLKVAAQDLQNTDDTSLHDQLSGIDSNLDTALTAADEFKATDPVALKSQLETLTKGANLLADSSERLAQGVKVLVDQTRQMGGGLGQASDFLLAMKRDAADPSMSGFYIPPQILTRPEFEKAAKLFISPDGHTARYLVQTALDPFGTAAMDQVDDIVAAAESSRPNTTLADADITMVGFTRGQNDIRDYYNADIRYIVLVTLIVVFFILVVLLRAILAPLYLVLTVVLSYMSALGITVIVFQFLLKQPIFWNTPGVTFLVLVAVGADYNLLLISRIKEEAHRGMRAAVIRTVGATGGVITSAGLIFAASMLALTVSSIAAVVQTGFIIGIGLLLDTFLVRTITVPAIAVLLGDKNWWPAAPPSKKKVSRKRRAPVPVGAAAGAAGSGARDGDWYDDVDDDDADTDFGQAAANASMVTRAWRTR